MNGLLNIVSREFRYNLFSWRMVLLTVLLMLAVVGASYGVAEMALMNLSLIHISEPTRPY